MTRKEIIRQLDKLRAEVDKPEPTVCDLMDEIQALRAQVVALKQQVAMERVRTYPAPVPYPAYPSPRPYYGGFTMSGGTATMLRNGEVIQ